MAIKTSCIAVLAACLGVSSAFAQQTTPRFKVIAFYTGKADAAHISFVNEARPWFARMAAEHQTIEQILAPLIGKQDDWHPDVCGTGTSTPGKGVPARAARRPAVAVRSALAPGPAPAASKTGSSSDLDPPACTFP